MTTDSVQLASRVKSLAREAGFDLARISEASPLHEERARYLAWIEEGRQGQMRWIRPEHAVRSADPANALPGARSVLCVGLSYWGGHRPNGRTGKIARYAWGQDYHRVMGDRLRHLAERLRRDLDGEHRWYVDTGPLMDKALAARSGLGWYGKNTNILTERFGSFVLLGEMITTLDLQPDPPLDRDCGACRLCLVACPTGALGPDYTIDSRKCISYLTIEHRGPIPRDLRASMGSWVLGCDICQDVCPPTMQPYLSNAAERREWAAEVRDYVSGREPDGSIAPAVPPLGHPLYPNGIRPDADLFWLLTLTHDQYVEAFRGTALKRAKCWMLRRNAAVALGNIGGPEAIGSLGRALRADEHPIVRGHAAWALGRIAGRHGADGVRDMLLAAAESESESDVIEEIEAAVGDLVAAARRARALDARESSAERSEARDQKRGGRAMQGSVDESQGGRPQDAEERDRLQDKAQKAQSGPQVEGPEPGSDPMRDLVNEAEETAEQHADDQDRQEK